MATFGVARGEALDNDAGFVCAGCAITVLADQNRTDDPQIVARMCTSCWRSKLRGMTPAQRAALRPASFGALPARAQWAIDKQLDLLDWDGK